MELRRRRRGSEERILPSSQDEKWATRNSSTAGWLAWLVVAGLRWSGEAQRWMDRGRSAQESRRRRDGRGLAIGIARHSAGTRNEMRAENAKD